jgi:hypothetical protein
LASLSAIHGTDLSSEDLQKMASELRTNRSINDVATETTS